MAYSDKARPQGSRVENDVMIAGCVGFESGSFYIQASAGQRVYTRLEYTVPNSSNAAQISDTCRQRCKMHWQQCHIKLLPLVRNPIFVLACFYHTNSSNYSTSNPALRHQYIVDWNMDQFHDVADRTHCANSR
jgi:hypothetical protein